MRAVWSIARRELNSYFNSPVAYIVLGVFLLSLGYLFFSSFFLAGFASLRNMFSLVPILFVVFGPALTMRLIAEERKAGTIELLMTLPIHDGSVVLGKFVGALLIAMIGVLLTLPYAVTVAALAQKGVPFDYGPVIGGYLGLAFLASSFLSMGLLASALTRNQIVAFIVGLTLCFFFFFVDKFAIFFPPAIGAVLEYLSVDYHFSNIARGVIDSRDVIFYLSLTAVSLLITVYALRQRQVKATRRAFVMSTFAVVVGLVFVNLISLREFVRFDLTRDRKFTLSQASKETVKHLKDVMTVSAYFTEGLPAPYASHTRYARDLLEEYRSASNGKFSFEMIDPTQAESAADKEKKKEVRRDIFGRTVRDPTAVERELMQLGIEPVEIRVIEDDQQQTKRAYMGVVVLFQGKREVIPVVQDIGNLEKDLTGLMRKLVRSKTPVLGLVQNAGPQQLDRFKALVAQNAQVKDVSLAQGSAIPSDVDALLVVGSGGGLDEKALATIQQFVQSGKNAAFLLDRVKIDPKTFQPQSSNGEKAEKVIAMLARYGVKVEDGLVLDVNCASLNVQEQRGELTFAMPMRYPFIPELSNLDQNNAVTRGVMGVVLPFTTSVSFKPTPGLHGVVLAQSSKSSWIENAPFDTNPRREWSKENIKLAGPYPLMVQVSGKLPHAQKESRLLVAGASTFIWDPFFNQPNQALALNVVDYLFADSALLAMRARGFVDVPLQQDVKDTTRNAVKLGNIFGVPALLVLYGIARWRLREKRRRTIGVDK